MHPDEQLLGVFLSQSEEHLDRLDESIIQLRDGVDQDACIAEIFRLVHTIKGGSGILGIDRIEKIAHATENLLSKLRVGEVITTSVCIDAITESLDQLRSLVDAIRLNKILPDDDDARLIFNLSQLSHATNSQEAYEKNNALSIESQIEAIKQLDDIYTNSSIVQKNVDSVRDTSDDSSSLVHTDLVKSIKVNVGLLDSLMNLVSEMVLARNRLLSFSKSSGDLNFLNTVRNIDVITMGLQERMMMTRMQPIRNIWSKFPKLIRELARENGKQIELIQIGAETELDRTLLETIRDPLTHILRNCVDHGIEIPSVRSKLSKSPTGTITLNAFHEKGMIVVEVDDDGAGMDFSLISRRAVEMDLISKDRISLLSEREIIDLVYTPGFSTKDIVTTMSGRGVGMDVVKSSVHEIGGTVEIISTEHVGTRIRLRIPLTLAIMPAVFVRCSEQQFAIPQSNVVEMVRHQPDKNKPGVEDFCGVHVLRLRERLIPLIYLNRELGICNEEVHQDDSINIVLVQAAGILFGLVADEILFMQDIVVKSVGPLMRGTAIYSGTTILGDGRVSLIFDVSGIAIRSGLISKLVEIEFQSMISEEASQIRDESDSFLLFDLNGLDRVAIPLAYVSRLESINISEIYQRGSKDVVMYSGQIMQLVWLDDLVDGAARQNLYADRQISVIVHYVDNNPIGFVAKKIFDIFHTASDITISGPAQVGISGSAIINGNVVSFLNVDEIISIAKKTNETQPRLTKELAEETYGLILSGS